MEPNGERGWFIDFHEALYLFSLKDDSLLKYPLTGLRPIAVDLAPDGKIWCISTAHERWRDRLPPTLRRIHIGYILSLDHQTNKLTTYEIPFGYSLPAGILVTNEGIWFGNRWNMPDVDWGISKLILEGKEGSTTVITPKEVEEWKLAEYDIAEVEGEEISPKTFELHPDQLIKYEDQRPLKMVEARGKGAPGHKFLIYPIENRTPERVGEMAQDNQGRIWFTTMMSGYIGVLTPISHPIDVPR